VSAQGYLSVAQVAALLGVNHKSVRREIAAGRLPALRIGRVLRIDPAVLDHLKEPGPGPADEPVEIRRLRPRSARGEFSSSPGS